MPIDTSRINPFLLPSVNLLELHMLPPSPGIYFAITASNKIVYIGKTTSLVARWREHHKLNELEAMGQIRIAYLDFGKQSCKDLHKIEQEFIYRLKPSLNGNGKRHPVNSRNTGWKERRETRYKENTIVWNSD